MGCSNSQEKRKVIPFSKLGVKLSVFDEFIELCGGYGELKDLTTTQVCYKFLSKRTILPKKTSYCDYLASQRHPGVGIAEVFVSHAWKYKVFVYFSSLVFT
jgi:hypothetical protein